MPQCPCIIKSWTHSECKEPPQSESLGMENHTCRPIHCCWVCGDKVHQSVEKGFKMPKYVPPDQSKGPLREYEQYIPMSRASYAYHEALNSRQDKKESLKAKIDAALEESTAITASLETITAAAHSTQEEPSLLVPVKECDEGG